MNESGAEFNREPLTNMGYNVEVGVWGSRDRTSGPINAVWFDRDHGRFQGGSGNHSND